VPSRGRRKGQNVDPSPGGKYQLKIWMGLFIILLATQNLISSYFRSHYTSFNCRNEFLLKGTNPSLFQAKTSSLGAELA